MTVLRKNAMDLLEHMPEEQLYYVVQILEGVTALSVSSAASKKKIAFEKLESLRKKTPYYMNYEEELELYREEKYGIESVD